MSDIIEAKAQGSTLELLPLSIVRPYAVRRVVLLLADSTDEETLRGVLLADNPTLQLTWVRTVRGARKAMETLHPDLIISDLHLRDGSALELFSLQIDKAPCPVILLIEQEDEALTPLRCDSGVIDRVVKRPQALAADEQQLNCGRPGGEAGLMEPPGKHGAAHVSYNGERRGRLTRPCDTPGNSPPLSQHSNIPHFCDEGFDAAKGAASRPVSARR